MNYYNNQLKADYIKMKKDTIQNLSFNNKLYKTNYDLIIPNDNIITESDGTIYKLRINEKKPPLFVGEYNLSIWNLKLGYLLNADIQEMIKKFSQQESYIELNNIINNKSFDINNYNKLIIIHSVVIKKNIEKMMY